MLANSNNPTFSLNNAALILLKLQDDLKLLNKEVQDIANEAVRRSIVSKETDTTIEIIEPQVAQIEILKIKKKTNFSLLIFNNYKNLVRKEMEEMPHQGKITNSQVLERVKEKRSMNPSEYKEFSDDWIAMYSE